MTGQHRQASSKGDRRARQANRQVNPFLTSDVSGANDAENEAGSPDESRELGLDRDGVIVEDVDSRELEGNRELFLGRPVITPEEINRELYMTWAADPEQNRKPRVLRDLSINLGNGQCMWTEPQDVPLDDSYDIFQTVVIAYPGSGKRAAFMHMSGLTGLTTGDDYDFSGRSLHTGFMKSSYPHHEGVWSWGNRMDQALLVVRNPRWTLVGYHELLHEIQYAHTWTEAYMNEDHVWSLRPTVAEWVEWRDQRFDDEIERWGWFIDFWMENGVLRDVHTHLPANTTWWEIVANPHRPYPSLEGYTPPAEPERNYHCTYDMVDSDGLAQGCQPRKVISFERLLDHTTGPAEGAKLAAALENNLNVDLIAEEARECIWRELIVRDVADVRHNRRDQAAPIEDFMFTLPQMNAIVAQLDRMLAKYTQGAWLTTPTAQDLVSNLQEYKFEVENDIAMSLYE